MRERTRAGLVALVAGVALALTAAPASATVAPTLYAAANCDADVMTMGVQPRVPHMGFSYFFCNDGLPPTAGINPNNGGVNAVTVPAKYGTMADSHTGLPAKAADAMTMLGSDQTPGPELGNIALDVDVSLPSGAPPAGGYPMVLMMHGCCSGTKTSWEDTSFDGAGEKWHYNNAWFASRGYVVVNYTARGFRTGTQGSTGETQLDSRSFEINDFQSLACQVLANETNWGAINAQGASFEINPARVVTTGGSYGGGFSWLAATDPLWTCTADTGTTDPMSLAASAPKYGWTDLAYTLVPNGLHSQLPGSLPAANGCDTGPKDINGADCPGTPNPIGTPKNSIVSGLYVTGLTGTTFPQSITDAFNCIRLQPYPFDDNPLCASTRDQVLPEFMRERSAYYQTAWFDAIDTDASRRVPIFNAGTLTDPLFPAYENRRMVNRILAEFPAYPIKQYYGDYQHFVQNKAKEWGDLCGMGMDRHVCTFADHDAGINSDPSTLLRRGVTTRLNRFIDHYAQPAGGYATVPADTDPDVTASLQVCPQNATGGQAADEPGPTFTAPLFEGLATNTLTLDMQGAQTTTSDAEPNEHAVNADPVLNLSRNGGRCPVETVIAGPGIASYTSEPLTGDATMIGSSDITIDFTLTGMATGLQFNARLYDVLPDGTAVMVDRGTRRVLPSEVDADPQVVFGLHGNGWRFPAGHRVRIEIAQDDDPFVRKTDIPSSAALSSVLIEAPIREADQMGTGTPDPKPQTPPAPPATSGGSPTAPTPAAKKCPKKKKGKKGVAAAKCKKKKKKKK